MHLHDQSFKTLNIQPRQSFNNSNIYIPTSINANLMYIHTLHGYSSEFQILCYTKSSIELQICIANFETIHLRSISSSKNLLFLKLCEQLPHTQVVVYEKNGLSYFKSYFILIRENCWLPDQKSSERTDYLSFLSFFLLSTTLRQFSLFLYIWMMTGFQHGFLEHE